MMRMMAVAALALSAACGGTGTAPEQGPAPRQDGGMLSAGATGGGGPNVFALLGARQQLALTGAQVTELDSIGRMWAVRNDSLQRQVGRPGERTDIALIRPVLEQMAANNEQSNAAIETVLNAEQRRIACTLPVVQRPERRGQADGGRMGGGGRPGGPGGGVRPGRGRDSVPGMRMRRGWPWCAATAPADSARSGTSANQTP